MDGVVKRGKKGCARYAGKNRSDRFNGKEETARNLKELGVADDIIMKSTGLSKEEIEKL